VSNKRREMRQTRVCVFNRRLENAHSVNAQRHSLKT
jgi:hypothetical protein